MTRYSSSLLFVFAFFLIRCNGHTEQAPNATSLLVSKTMDPTSTSTSSITQTTTYTPTPTSTPIFHHPEILSWAVFLENSTKDAYVAIVLHNTNDYSFISPGYSTFITLKGSDGRVSTSATNNLSIAANGRTAILEKITYPPQRGGVLYSEIAIDYQEIEFPKNNEAVPNWKTQVMKESLQWLGDTNFLVTIENTSEYPCHMGKSVVIAFDNNKKISGFGKANLFPENEIPIPAGKKFGYDAYIPSSLYDRSATFEVFPKLAEKYKVCAKDEITEPDKEIPLEIIKTGGGGEADEWNFGILLKNPSNKFTIYRIDYHVNVYDGEDYLVASSHGKNRGVHIQPNETGGLGDGLVTFIKDNWRDNYRVEGFIRIEDIELYTPYEKPLIDVVKITRSRGWNRLFYEITNNTQYIFRIYGMMGVIFDAEGNIIGGGYTYGNWQQIFVGDVYHSELGISTLGIIKEVELYPFMCAQRVNCIG
jgi:hypothetical protein